jgi:hypothetical protein
VVGDLPIGPSHSVVTNQNLWLDPVSPLS